MKLPVLICFALAWGLHAETHRFSPVKYHNTFSAAHEPVLRIKPGDRVVTSTVDARGGDAEGKRVAERPNPETGPFYIEGAERGDTLVVRIEKIDIARGTAWSGSLLAPYAVDPGFLRSERAQRGDTTETWTIDKAKGVARLTSSYSPKVIEVPLRPMLGCIATAPDRKEAIATSTPDTFGGNMDYNGMNAGVTVMLPVYETGALLFLGDGHAAQSDGEILGNALETAMNVEFSVDLIKKKSIGWPRLENSEYIMVLGSARPLLQALQHATTELQSWLMSDYGFDERGAALLMGHAVRYDIANIVDPHFTVAAKIPKKLLGGAK